MNLNNTSVLLEIWCMKLYHIFYESFLNTFSKYCFSIVNYLYNYQLPIMNVLQKYKRHWNEPWGAARLRKFTNVTHAVVANSQIFNRCNSEYIGFLYSVSDFYIIYFWIRVNHKYQCCLECHYKIRKFDDYQISLVEFFFAYFISLKN